jgi:predicted nucleic acid-binding protein
VLGEVAPLLRAMIDHGFWLSDIVHERILRKAGEI